MKRERRTKKSRRGRGEGTVWQRPDGRWCAQISQGYVAGKRKRRTIFGDTKQGVLDEVARFRSRQIEGSLPEPSTMTVEGFLERWMASSGGESVAGSTAASYRRNIKTHIVPHIGPVAIQKLTALHVEHMLASMMVRGDKKASPRMRVYALSILSQALDQAVKWGFVFRNVCDAVDRPQVPHYEIHQLDESQCDTFLKGTASEEHAAFWCVALGTGARLGELLALKWVDVDFDKRLLSIRRTLSIVGKQTIIKEPKTRSGRRQITLGDRALRSLTKLRKDQLKAGFAASEWVFIDEKGHRLKRGRMQRRLPVILKELGLPRIRMHDLRHSHATLLLLAGTHPRVVQERLGHSSVAITLDVYSHVLPSLQTEVEKKLNRLFG
jgi:integrase